jgi:hypothetical protein
MIVRFLRIENIGENNFSSTSNLWKWENLDSACIEQIIQQLNMTILSIMKSFHT